MAQWMHASCPRKECGSSDAFSYKEGDSHGYCFSCGESSPVDPDNPGTPKKRRPNIKQMTLEDIQELEIRGFEDRQIKKNIAAYFDVRVDYEDDGETIRSHYYPYTRKGKLVAYKRRRLPKKFDVIGKLDSSVDLFGQSRATGSNTLVITEGELDAMSVAVAQYEKYGKFYPVVSLPSASSLNPLLHNREWVRSFKEVILCLDQDEAGEAATEKAAKIIGYDKVKICKLPEKDASDVLTKHGSAKLMSCLFDAKPYSPAGVVRGEEIWNQFTEMAKAVAIAYPPCLGEIQQKTKGMREGSITLFTSGTGSGKSTVIKEIILHVLNTTEDSVGLVSLEESVADTAEKFIGMQLKKNLAWNEKVSEKELRKGYESVFGDERLILLDHQGSVSDDSLLDKIEHLALIGCKYIVLDHITIAVSEGAEGRTGNEAVDFIMSGLLKIVKKHNIWLGVISHLRKVDNKTSKSFEEGKLPTMDDIKGSGSIKQISFDIIGFARDMTHKDPKIRNTIRFRVLKCRRTGDTGDAGAASYDPKTGRLTACDLVDFDTEDFEEE